jgi:RNA polymerase sigma-70 factor (ECF subfamily)
LTIPIETLENARSGDSDAFDELVRCYRQRVYGTIVRSIGAGADAEDVRQEVFVRVYLSLRQLRNLEVFESWLYRLTVNASYDYLRKRRRSVEVCMTDLSDEQLRSADATAGTKRVEADNSRTMARELMDAISESDRELLWRKEIHGLSLKELRQIYSCNEGALKVRLFRARKRALEMHGRMAMAPAVRPMNAVAV